ncbi:LamG-like jellyroll fold domain-containing protein [Nonomuraea sp. NPDC059194]|uniref:LamG-like jellyroll fold domain-containing protein n=1 Tax=Nonomuraea sp. NPDC059194 TaxID=3346764 RepID=UPI0036952051
MTASLLVTGTTRAAVAEPEPSSSSNTAAPSVTTFPRPADPDAPLRAAIEEAKKQGKPVAVEAVYTETSRTWAYPDGHLTLQSYAGPSQLKQPDGSWAFINTDLVEQDGFLKPKLAKADVQFSLGGNGPFASMERGNGQKFSLSWLKDLPKPEITGNVARYIDAAGPMADLVVTALPTGFRHDVVLRERPTGPVEFRIPVQTEGLTLAESKKGKGLTLTDGKGKRVASAAEPVAIDAGPSPAEANTREVKPPRTGKIDTQVVTENGQQLLVLTPDPAFLNDPATRYPLTVDPTTTLPLLSDKVISNDSNANTSPASPKLETSVSRTYTDGHLTNVNSLLKFDTSVLAGRSVGNARLEMYAEQDVGCRWYGPGGVEVKRVTSGWNADNVGWSNKPAVTSFGSSIQICPNTSQLDPDGNWIPRTITWDITAMANAWAGGAQSEGVQVSGSYTNAPSQGSGFWIYYHSAERVGGKPPKLTVNYFLPPEIPTVTAESIDSLTGNDAIARSQNVKVGFKSAVPEATNLDYTVTVNDSTMVPPPSFPTGHAAHWKFDEATGAAAAADASSNGYTATYTGSRHAATTGKLGGAVLLNDGADLPNSYATTSKPVLNQNASFSLSTWVKLSDSESIQYIASQDGSPFGMSLYYLGSSWQKVRLQISGTGGSTGYGVWVDSAKLAKIDTWTHLIAMYDAAAAKIRLYIDGALSAETDYTPTGTVTSGPFRIGSRKTSEIQSLRGSLDDMRLYQRALTLKEIKDLYGEVAATSYNAKPSGQVINQTFALHNPASLKFVVKACRAGVSPPSCNESPAYRITSDAPMLPSDTETGMADPTRPILSGMVNRPSGGPVTAKYYLYDNAGTPVGSAPLGTRTVNGGERASFQIPASTVQPGTTYQWQMVACASGETAADEVCTSKTASISFTTPGTPPPPPAEDIKTLTLGKDSFVIKTAKTDPTACNGNPCTVTDDTVIRIGGTGVDKTAAVIGFKLDELPNGVSVSEGVLKLGVSTCPAGTCPSDAVITATSLKSAVTSESKGSDLAADADPNVTPHSLPLSSPQADIGDDAFSWLLLTSNKDEVITFGDARAAEQPALAITYLPAGPPSEVLNLTASGGDASVLASWGLPKSNGSMAMLDGYDVEVADNSGSSVKSLQVSEPYAAISGLANGQTYSIKVRAKTAFGSSAWEGVNATTKAVPPPPVPTPGTPCVPFLDTPPSAATKAATSESGVQAYLDRVNAYYQAQDAVLEGRAATIWDASGVTPSAPSTAKLSLLNVTLVQERDAMTQNGKTRSGSSVQLSNPVVQAMPDGGTRVTVEVTRKWTETTEPAPNATPARTSAATAGTIEPSEATISIFVFDRCGNITIIDAPIEENEDSTDHADIPPISGGGGAGGNEPAMIPCGKQQSKRIINCEVRDRLGTKGWIVRSFFKSHWPADVGEGSTGAYQRWLIDSYENVSILQPTWDFWGYNTLFGKTLVKNFKLSQTGGACFLSKVVRTSTTVGTSVEPEKVGLNWGFTFSGDASEKCSEYNGKPTSKIRHKVILPQALIESECHVASGVNCWLTRYKHYLHTEYSFDFKYTHDNGMGHPVTTRYVTTPVLHDLWCKVERNYGNIFPVNWNSVRYDGVGCRARSTLGKKKPL